MGPLWLKSLTVGQSKSNFCLTKLCVGASLKEAILFCDIPRVRRDAAGQELGTRVWETQGTLE